MENDIFSIHLSYRSDVFQLVDLLVDIFLDDRRVLLLDHTCRCQLLVLICELTQDVVLAMRRVHLIHELRVACSKIDELIFNIIQVLVNLTDHDLDAQLIDRAHLL